MLTDAQKACTYCGGVAGSSRYCLECIAVRLDQHAQDIGRIIKDMQRQVQRESEFPYK